MKMKGNGMVWLLLVLFSFFVAVSVAQEDFEDFEASFEDSGDVKEDLDVKGEGEVFDHNLEEDSAPEEVPSSDFYDEEEFEGFEESEFIHLTPKNDPEDNTEEVAAPAAPPAREPVKPKFNWREKDWTMEIIYGSIFVVYLANLFFGKYRNHSIASEWVKHFGQIFKKNFYLVGHGKDLIVQESFSKFTLKATGRVNCKGCLVDIDLKKRQDLLSMVLSLFSKTKDTVTISFPLNKEDMSPFVFGLISQSGKSLMKNKDLATSYKKSYNKKLHLYTDCTEVSNAILSPEVLKLVKKNSDLIEWIYVTDIHPELINTNLFQVKFRIPGDLSELDSLMKLIFFLLDFLPTIKLSKSAQTSVGKIRATLLKKSLKEINQKKQEADKEKKEEEKREKLSKMSDADLEKFKQKQEKKRMRKMMSKQSKMVVGM